MENRRQEFPDLSGDDFHQTLSCFHSRPRDVRRDEQTVWSVTASRGQSSAMGSWQRTSRPAALISPAFNAAARSASQMIGPRPVFSRSAVFFIFRNASVFMIPSVCSLSGAWMERMSDSASRVSKSNC